MANIHTVHLNVSFYWPLKPQGSHNSPWTHQLTLFSHTQLSEPSFPHFPPTPNNSNSTPHRQIDNHDTDSVHRDNTVKMPVSTE